MTIEKYSFECLYFYLVKTLVNYIFLMLDNVTGFKILFRDTKSGEEKWFSRINFLMLSLYTSLSSSNNVFQIRPKTRLNSSYNLSVNILVPIILTLIENLIFLIINCIKIKSRCIFSICKIMAIKK